jgi:hypothetical protein
VHLRKLKIRWLKLEDWQERMDLLVISALIAEAAKWFEMELA